VRKLGPRSGAIDELGLGGGVWRAKHHYDSQLIACACMHYKYQVVEVIDFSSLSKFSLILQLIFIIEKISEYGDEKSLCYGIDWKKESDSKLTIASCSFYDNLVNLWEIKQ